MEIVPANAVAAHADRCNARHYVHLGHMGGVDVGKRRVHVVRAGRRNCHAVYHHLGAFIPQSMQQGDGGKFTVFSQTDARQVPEEFRGVAAPRLITVVYLMLGSGQWNIDIRGLCP